MRRERIPILVRITRDYGFTFAWYLRRRRHDGWYWKRWRAVHTPEQNLRKAIQYYRDYAHYWVTGDY